MPTHKFNDTTFITGIRAIAVLLVFLVHSGGGGLQNFGMIAREFIDWGRFSISLFLVVSGFTIFYQIYHDKYNFKSFMFIRFLRLSIPYYPVVFFIAIYLNYSGDLFNEWAKLNKGGVSLANILHHLTYTSFIRLRYANTILGVEWTLSVEAFYYVCLGVLITSKRYKQCSLFSKYLIWTLLFSLSFSFQYTPIEHYIYPKTLSPDTSHFLPFKYGYAFILGGLAYYIRTLLNYERHRKLLNVLSNTIFVFVPLMVFSNLFWHYFANGSVFYTLLTFISVVLLRDSAPFTVILNNPPIQFLGKISYSFYLWHFFILKSKIVPLNYIHSPSLLFIAHFVISLGIAFIWFTLFEKTIYGACKKWLFEKDFYFFGRLKLLGQAS